MEEFCMNLLYTNVPGYPHLKRIYNMLGMHAILYCTRSAVEELKRRLAIQYQDHCHTNWDLRAARYQSHGGIVYAMCKPFLYQAKEHGGQEEVTKFELSDSGVLPSPPVHWFV